MSNSNFGSITKVDDVGMSLVPPIVICPCWGWLFRNHWITGSGLPPWDEHVNSNGSPSRATGFCGVINGGPGETIRLGGKRKILTKRLIITAFFEKNWLDNNK